MRPIDADALLSEMRYSGRAAYMLVQDAPTIDTVPVVRCRDCKHKQVLTRENTVTCYFHGKLILMDADGFCYCGEKMGKEV